METKSLSDKQNKRHYWDFPGGPAVETSLPMQGVRVQSLVRELGSHMPCGQKAKTKTEAIL